MATGQKETLRRSPRFQSLNPNPNPKHHFQTPDPNPNPNPPILSQKKTLRRSPHFQSPNPNPNPNPHFQSSNPNPNPNSSRPILSEKKRRLSSKYSENLSEKDSFLGSGSCRRSSVRLALMDRTNLVGSFEEIGNNNSKKKRECSFEGSESKKDAICEVNCDLGLSRRSVRLNECNKQNSLDKIGKNRFVQCDSTFQQNASVKDSVRKSPRLAEMGKNNGESCLKTQNNQLISNKSRKASTVCGNASKKDALLNQRKSKRVQNKPTEITKNDTEFEKKDSDSDSCEELEKDGLRGKKRKREEIEGQMERSNVEKDSGFDGWSEEQEMALQKAYFTARPSPHFWKKVSKMVPGKNAEECFSKIHSSLKTPPSIPPRSRLNKSNTDLSPFHKFDLLQNPNFAQNPKPKTRKVSKQKRAVDARKTVRKILKKQQKENQVQEADYFSQFENSPFQLPSHFKLSEICSSSSALQNKTLSKLNPNPNPNPNSDPSPAVLKQIKNMALHEKYIDHLHCVDAKRKACVRVCENTKGETVNLKDAKVSLASEAQDYIGYFKRVQSDPFGDFVRSDEEDEL